jgi:hypothetical protein
MLLLVLMRLSQIKVGDVGSSVSEWDCRLEWYSLSARVGSSVEEKGIESLSQIDCQKSTFRAPKSDRW